MAQKRDALRERDALVDKIATLRHEVADFVHNVEHQYVTDGARVREDGAYHRLKAALIAARKTAP